MFADMPGTAECLTRAARGNTHDTKNDFRQCCIAAALNVGRARHLLPAAPDAAGGHAGGGHAGGGGAAGAGGHPGGGHPGGGGGHFTGGGGHFAGGGGHVYRGGRGYGGGGYVGGGYAGAPYGYASAPYGYGYDPYGYDDGFDAGPAIAAGIIGTALGVIAGAPGPGCWWQNHHRVCR